MLGTLHGLSILVAWLERYQLRMSLVNNKRGWNCATGTANALQVDTMKTGTFIRYPKVTGSALALLSLLVGATALEAADFGAPGWVFVPLLIWLATFGLPTTLTVLLLASVWGRTSPFYGFWFFCLVAAVVAAVAETVSVKAVGHFAGGRYAN